MAPLPRTSGSPSRPLHARGGRGGGGLSSPSRATLAKWRWIAGCLCVAGLTLCFWAESISVGTGPDGERISLSSAIGNTLRSGGQGLIRSQKGQVTPDRPLRIVGTHHKTGTMLLSMLLREGYRVHMERTGRSNGLMMGYFGNAEAPGAPFAFYYCDHLYADSWNKTDASSDDHLPKLVDRHQFFGDAYDFVHLVRDPLELIVSAYLYHYSTPPDWQEPWLYEQHPVSNYAFMLDNSSCKAGDRLMMSWYDLLHCLNDEDGVLAEATFQTHFGALPSMTAAARSLHDKPGTRTLQLGLEEFQEGNFDDAVRRMYAFFGFPKDEVEEVVRGCSQYDLKRQSKEQKSWNQHVTTGKFDKGKLRRVLMEKYTDPVFLEARRVLGYPKQTGGS